MPSHMQRLFLLTALFANSTVVLATEYKDDDKVSSMKGQLVEVGDRNKFHSNYPRLNLSLNPFGLVTGTYSVSGSYAVTDNIAPRVDISISEKTEDQNARYEVGGGAQIFFRKMYNGIYLEPGVVRIHETLSVADDDWRYDVFGPQVLLGYAWFWDSGFNVQLAAGMGRNLMSSHSEAKPSEDDAASIDSGANTAGRTFGNGYLRVGYAF